MRTITTTVYRVNELDPDVRARVIDRYRDILTTHNWWDDIYKDFKTIAEILGVSLHAGEPKFSGFYGQGDGASFTGMWSYNSDWRTQLTDHAPLDADLHDIGAQLEAIALDYNSTPWVSLGRRSRYVHLHDKNVIVTDSEYVTSGGDVTALPDHAENEILYQLRRLMRWLYQQLENEYSRRTSDAAVAVTLTINDYEFFADGTPYQDQQ